MCNHEQAGDKGSSTAGIITGKYFPITLMNDD